jgi:hypothetical protein
MVALLHAMGRRRRGHRPDAVGVSPLGRRLPPVLRRGAREDHHPGYRRHGTDHLVDLPAVYGCRYAAASGRRHGLVAGRASS